MIRSSLAFVPHHAGSGTRVRVWAVLSAVPIFSAPAVIGILSTQAWLKSWAVPMPAAGISGRNRFCQSAYGSEKVTLTSVGSAPCSTEEMSS